MLRLTLHAALVLLPLQPPPAPPSPADTADMSAFVTRFFAGLPAELRVPRAAVVVVVGDRIAFARGVGRTAAGDPVDPARTLFRAASNSKLVVATAVMQLAERARWQLSDDVDRYLPPAARLGGRGLPPVTIAHLLTHTGGLEDSYAGAVTLPRDRQTLAAFFARHRPGRVEAPGLEASYSNVGLALAGYLVEVASGEPFDRYAEREVFAPLGMTRSSFAQPAPAAWTRDLAGGPPRAGRTDVVFNPYPAASLVATPLDMGRFVAAHLGGGSAYGGRILRAESVAEMHATHWRAQPDAPGVAYGFFEGEERGHRTLFHTGDSGDHSVVFLLPDDRVGFYLVYSGSDEQAALRERFTRAFVDRYVVPPNAAPARPVASEVAVPIAALTGTYRGAQYARSTYEKVKAMFLQVTLRDGGGGTLIASPPGGGPPVRLRRVGPLTFHGDSGEVVAFRRGAHGAVVGFTLGGFIWDPSSWDRVGLLEDGRLHVALLAGSFAVLALRLVAWPLAGALRRVRGQRRPGTLGGAEQRWWRWSAVASAGPFVAGLAALATAFLSFQHPVVAVPRAAAVLGLGLLVCVLGGLVLVPAAIVGWRRRWWTLPRRTHVSLVAAAFVVLAPVLAYWRLLLF